LSYDNQTKAVCDVIKGKVYRRVTAVDITTFALYTACDSTNIGNYVSALQEVDTCAMARIGVTSSASSSTRKTKYLGLVSPFGLQSRDTGCGQGNGEV
jgi:hypothetical protein